MIGAGQLQGTIILIVVRITENNKIKIKETRVTRGTWTILFEMITSLEVYYNDNINY